MFSFLSVPPEFDQLEQNITVMAGRRAIVTCEAQGDLPINMMWFKGEERKRVSINENKDKTIFF